MSEATTSGTKAMTTTPSDLIPVWRVSSPALPSRCVADSENDAVDVVRELVRELEFSTEPVTVTLSRGTMERAVFEALREFEG